MKEIFLATKNKKKIEEIKKIFKGVKIHSINDGIKISDVVEDGETFLENSKKKALSIAKELNMVTLSDDSGLCVDALDGRPGVYSSRFAGVDGDDEKNNEKLLSDMKGVEKRDAHFMCVITIGYPDGSSRSYEGRVDGVILDKLVGEDGFGYDPLFYLESYGKTMAELKDEKNKISHRALALKKVLEDFHKGIL